MDESRRSIPHADDHPAVLSTGQHPYNGLFQAFKRDFRMEKIQMADFPFSGDFPPDFLPQGHGGAGGINAVQGDSP